MNTQVKPSFPQKQRPAADLRKSISSAPKNISSSPAHNPTTIIPKTPPPFIIRTESLIWKKAFFVLIGTFLVGMLTVGYEIGFHVDEMDMNLYGKSVWSYYQTGGKDSSYIRPQYEDGTKVGVTIPSYGTFFELVAVGINKMIGNENGYEFNVRHALNQIFAVLTVLFAALLVRLLGGGYLGAIITTLLLMSSPTFVGHGFMNTKDIPFALGYTASLYFMVRLLKELPRVHWGSLIGFMVSFWILMSIRPAGLIVVAYCGLFGLSYILLRPAARTDSKALLYSILKVVGAMIVAYVLTVAIWPTLHKNPLTGYLELFNYVKKFPQRVPLLFNGQEIDSLTIPKNYLYRILGLTIPAALLFGFLGGLLMLAIRLFQRKFYSESFLLFVGLFPVMYAVSSKVNLYSQWRHFLFLYPVLVGFVGITIARLLVNASLRKQFISLGILLLMMSHPIYSIAKDHKYAYFYYNEFSGGIKKTFNDYESDYWQMSLKPSVEWLMKNEPTISTSKDSITVITNALVATQYLFKKRYPNAKVKVVYSGIKGYGSLKWDYAIFSCLFVPREVLLFGWPPYGTIHSEKLDGKSLMVIMKHADHDDENAMKAMQQLQWARADSLFTAYLSKNPTNYGLYPPAVLAKYNLNKANEGILLAQRASVAIANDALLRYYTGLCWWSKGNPKNAIQEMNAAIQLKCQDLTVYQNLARVYEQSGDKVNAQKTLAAFSARK